MQRNYRIGNSAQENREAIRNIQQFLAFYPEGDDKKSLIIFMEPLLSFASSHYLSNDVSKHKYNIEIFNQVIAMVVYANTTLEATMMTLNSYMADKRFTPNDEFLAAINSAILAYNKFVMSQIGEAKAKLEKNTKELIHQSVELLAVSKHEKEALKQKIENQAMQMITQTFVKLDLPLQIAVFQKLSDDMMAMIKREVNDVYVPAATREIQDNASVFCLLASAFSAGLALACVAYESPAGAVSFALGSGLLLFGSTKTDAIKPDVQPIEFRRAQ